MNKKGSYTVEAAFIIPIVLGICFTVWYTTYILHDRVVLYGNLKKIDMLIAEGFIKPDSEKIDIYVKRGLWYASIKKREFKKGVTNISGKIMADMTLEIPVMNKFIGKRYVITVSEKLPAKNPDIVRRFLNNNSEESSSDKNSTDDR